MSASPEKESPPATSAEGQCNAVGANADTPYTGTRQSGNGAFQGRTGVKPASAAYRGSTGRIWRYRGKKARVLDMLARTPSGITQWDTLPWHTRLGGTIHAMREDGLSISTEIEGDYRHARYRLQTAGALFLQDETEGGPSLAKPYKAP